MNYGRQFCQSYESLQSSSTNLIDYRVQTLRFALTLLEEQSIFAMSVFFRVYGDGKRSENIGDKGNADNRSKGSSLSARDDSATANRPGSSGGGGGVERMSSGGNSSSWGSENYGILLTLLNSWIRDIRHLDSVKPEILEGSIDYKIMLCARWEHVCRISFLF